MKTNYNEYSIIKFYYLTNYCGIPILISTINIQKKVKSCKTQLEVSIKYPTQIVSHIVPTQQQTVSALNRTLGSGIKFPLSLYQKKIIEHSGGKGVASSSSYKASIKLNLNLKCK